MWMPTYIWVIFGSDDASLILMKTVGGTVQPKGTERACFSEGIISSKPGGTSPHPKAVKVQHIWDVHVIAAEPFFFFDTIITPLILAISNNNTGSWSGGSWTSPPWIDQEGQPGVCTWSRSEDLNVMSLPRGEHAASPGAVSKGLPEGAEKSHRGVTADGFDWKRRRSERGACTIISGTTATRLTRNRRHFEGISTPVLPEEHIKNYGKDIQQRRERARAGEPYPTDWIPFL